MISDTKACRDCGGRMARGFVASDDAGSGTSSLLRWFGGAPVMTWMGGLKVRKKDGLELAAFRCERCNLVLYFASAS